MHRLALLALIGTATAELLPEKGLVIDLDADKGVTLEDGDKVAVWTNQAAVTPSTKEFVKRDEGRKEAGSGRPSLVKIKGRAALDFRQQELVCMDEDAFDGLSTGKGHTWIAVLAVHEQREGLKDVNSFFGNLRNGEKYEGIWGCLNDDNTPWWGARNGITFGRFDANNPKIEVPAKLTSDKFHLLAGRMAAGTGTVALELFVDSAKAAATGEVPVNAAANPSRMAIGQERDATSHPGVESFDGQIARFLVWERPLTDEELSTCFQALELDYLKTE
ncbi:LamG-like jellyroll fold domain-containing protein [Haloferula sp. BvORR071]|uniref:LamG-like jellyroll fold domain-containing protein n=1 Tax=Haloferula sp. BvORR071 TaxID=1396141 RepID=UPI00055692A2|nr:LamG-like jellyroll fold domain-containing protein [Haloferula sp. BvORR071]